MYVMNGVLQASQQFNLSYPSFGNEFDISGGPTECTTFNQTWIRMRPVFPHETSFQTTSASFQLVYKCALKSAKNMELPDVSRNGGWKINSMVMEALTPRSTPRLDYGVFFEGFMNNLKETKLCIYHFKSYIMPAVNDNSADKLTQ